MSWKRHAFAPIAVVSFGALALAAWPFTIDDAFIVARYAERLARGAGYTFNDGEVSDGVTGPLWLAPLVLGARLGVEPLWVAKGVSCAAGVAALLWAAHRARARRLGQRAGWLVLLIGCSSLPYVVWGVAGLETGLAALLSTLFALSVTRRPHPNTWLAAAAFALLPWLRPELLAFCCALLLALALRSRPAALRVLALGLASIAALLAFRQLLFGHWLPMAASAKPPLLEHGVSYVVDALLRPRSLVLAAIVLAGLRAIGREGTVYVCALLVHACAVVLVGGDWMPARRLFVPVVPVLALLTANVLARGSLRRPRTTLVACAALLLTSVLELVPELREARAAGALRQTRGAELAERVCGARAPVAMVDIGLVGWACPAQTLIDLGGLTEPRIAYARGGHLTKQVDAGFLEARAPGLVVLHSRARPRVDGERRVRWFAGYPVERRLLAMPFVQRGYQVRELFEYAPSYHYVLLVPRGRPR